MKRISMIFLMSCAWLSIIAQDVVILRTGDELEGKVINASQTAVTIEVKKRTGLFSKETASTTLEPSLIYMIKYKERGNLYFKNNGKRVSGEKQKLDRTADIIYLIDGKEIQAWDLNLNDDNITFRAEKEPQKAKSSSITIANSAVFMIKYSDGSRDIITDIANRSEQPKADAAPQKEETPQIKVVFHTVKTGDTLARIADEYGVTIEDLRDWNEIAPQIKDNAKLKIGTQFMIQQTIKK